MFKKTIHYYTGEIPLFIENIFKKNTIRNIADLGVGHGAILYSLFKKGYLDNIERVIAVDISKASLDTVKKISSKILCILADTCKLDMLDDSSLDLVISTQVIEHIEDENKFIEEVYRILKQGGFFYLSTVYKKWYAWYFYRCNGRWTLDPTHLREYNDEDTFLNKLKTYNFQILANKKTMHWFPVTDFIFKRIGMGVNIYHKKHIKLLRLIKVPILGYYNWELVFKKI